ncbi:WD40-repeat-containing domain protein [Myxozyma melibiosi]|uniref:WD40-repeat-containing domain protein n=1 Tax=Myxozyma melibiosi TaxID=54550 RepID=A0ABR1F9P0_9ASCO
MKKYAAEGVVHTNNISIFYYVSFFPLQKRDQPQVFATVGDNVVLTCACGTNEQQKVKILATYVDCNPDEAFCSIAWTSNPRTGAPWLAVGGKSGVVKIIDCSTGTLVRSLVGHGDEILDLQTSPTHPHVLASSSGDHTIRIWNLDERYVAQPCAVICAGEGHREQVLSVAFHDSGRFLVSGGMDNRVDLWALPDLDKLEVDPDNPVVLYWSHFTTNALHANYVDSVAFYGDLILSKAAKEHRIVLWRIDGFASNLADYLGQQNAPTSHDKSKDTLSAFGSGFTRLLQFSIPHTTPWYMRFGIGHGVGCGSTLVMGNDAAKVYVFQLKEYELTNEDDEDAPSDSHSSSYISSSSYVSDDDDDDDNEEEEDDEKPETSQRKPAAGTVIKRDSIPLPPGAKPGNHFALKKAWVAPSAAYAGSAGMRTRGSFGPADEVSDTEGKDDDDDDDDDDDEDEDDDEDDDEEEEENIPPKRRRVDSKSYKKEEDEDADESDARAPPRGGRRGRGRARGGRQSRVKRREPPKPMAVKTTRGAAEKENEKEKEKRGGEESESSRVEVSLISSDEEEGEGEKTQRKSRMVAEANLINLSSSDGEESKDAGPVHGSIPETTEEDDDYDEPDYQERSGLSIRLPFARKQAVTAMSTIGMSDEDFDPVEDDVPLKPTGAAFKRALKPPAEEPKTSSTLMQKQSSSSSSSSAATTTTTSSSSSSAVAKKPTVLTPSELQALIQSRASPRSHFGLPSAAVLPAEAGQQVNTRPRRSGSSLTSAPPSLSSPIQHSPTAQPLTPQDHHHKEDHNQTQHTPADGKPRKPYTEDGSSIIADPFVFIKPHATLDIPRIKRLVRHLSFSPHGDYLVACGDGGFICVWKVYGD